MTQKHSLPSKFEEFVPIAAAALGFSILFLFALSSFVNNLYQTGPGAAHGPEIAATTPHTPAQTMKPGQTATGKSTPETHDAAAAKPMQKPAATPTIKTVSIGQMLKNGNAKKGAQGRQKMFRLS